MPSRLGGAGFKESSRRGPDDFATGHHDHGEGAALPGAIGDGVLPSIEPVSKAEGNAARRLRETEFHPLFPTAENRKSGARRGLNLAGAGFKMLAARQAFC